MKMNEIAGIGNWNTAEYWEYSPRTGHRGNPDPVRNTRMSPYSVFHGNPILMNDEKGDNPVVVLAPEAAAAAFTLGAGMTLAYASYVYTGQVDWHLVEVGADAALAAWQLHPNWQGIGQLSIPTVDALATRPLVMPFAKPVSDTRVHVLTGDKLKKANERKFYYVTYQMSDNKGNVYVGRTSGFGTPAELVKKRMQNHHMRFQGFDPNTAVPVTAAESMVAGGFSNRKMDPAYWFNRGAEEAGIQLYKAMGRSGNSRAGISPSNREWDRYTNTFLQNKVDLRDEDNCVNCGSMNTNNIDVGTPGVNGTTRH